jgi:hypothetical protein
MLTLPPRLSSLNLSDVVGEDFRVRTDGVGRLVGQVGLVHSKLSDGNRREVAGGDRFQNGTVGVESTDGFQCFDAGVSVRL